MAAFHSIGLYGVYREKRSIVSIYIFLICICLIIAFYYIQFYNGNHDYLVPHGQKYCHYNGKPPSHQPHHRHHPNHQHASSQYNQNHFGDTIKVIHWFDFISSFITFTITVMYRYVLELKYFSIENN